MESSHNEDTKTLITETNVVQSIPQSIPGRKIFAVEDANPPQDFNAPYSQLPSNVVIGDILSKIQIQNQKMSKNTNDIINQVLFSEHMTAIVSDTFWYIICIFFKTPEQFKTTIDNLLDRLSANFVSLFLDFEVNIVRNEELSGKSHSKGTSIKIIDKSEKNSDKKKTIKCFIDPHLERKNAKKKLFTKFYDIVAQAVCYSLFYAFPKSRTQFDIDLIYRMMQTLSNLFNGIQISKVYCDHWNLDLGTGNEIKKLMDKYIKQRDAENLTEQHPPENKQKTTKIDREVHIIQYSPLFERYLGTHRYETVNSVKKWRMLMTNREEAHKRDDIKFNKMLEIVEKIKVDSKELREKTKDECNEIERKKRMNKIECARHIRRLSDKKKEILDNGRAEYANYLVSMFNKKLEKVKNLDAQS